MCAGARLRVEPEVDVVVRVDRPVAALAPAPVPRALRGAAAESVPAPLLVVAASRARDAVERRLRAVSRAGRLAGWLGDPDDFRR